VHRLAEVSARKWPWVFGDEPPSEDGPRAAGEMIEIERRLYYGASDRPWVLLSEHTSYGPAMTLWALEAILGTTSATGAGRTNVRGEPCARYVVEALPGEIAGQIGIKLVDAPGPDDDWRVLSAEVCIDDSGFLRRITWSPTVGRRFKPGLLARVAMTLGKGPSPDDCPRRRGPGLECH
jgi:hypothetical protein